MNMLYLLDEYRHEGYGKELVDYWENRMKENGYDLVSSLLLKNEPFEKLLKAAPRQELLGKKLTAASFALGG